MIWKEKRVLLLALSALFVVNFVFFVTYRVRYDERVRSLDAALEQAEAQLARSRANRSAAEQQLQAYRQVAKDIQTVYNDWWSTPEQRLTPLILEIKHLAVESQLVPKSTSYNLQDRRREQGVDALSIAFAVQGPYQRVRQLINLIELSQQFVTIDSISFSGGGPDALSLNLQLKTLFRADDSNTGSKETK